ncbi:Transcription-repair-coupling factor [bioreactor metagenome]|uniref:Transcription-repair-coupling factor n=1 Tax=bioreactor metagenome TaxID=1076179 RepID=A0A644WJK8_9ZZZZ
MNLLTDILNCLPSYRRLLAALDNGAVPAAVSGLSAVHRAHFAAGLRRDTGRSVVLVCADESESSRLARDIEAFSGESAGFLGAREFTFHPAATVSREWEHRRLSMLHLMSAGKITVMTATVEALLQRTIPKELFGRICFSLTMGAAYDLTELTDKLTNLGYVRCDQVEGVGQFALRGGILDVFSPGSELPVRAEFWGDEIDTMGSFQVSTQRRVAQLDTAVILPSTEVLTAYSSVRDCPAGDLGLPAVYPRMATAADYLPPDAVVLFCESSRIAERARAYQWQLEEDVKALIETQAILGKFAVFARSLDELLSALDDWPLVWLDSFVTTAWPLPPRSLIPVQARQLPSYGSNLEAACADLISYQTTGFGTVVLAPSERSALSLQALLRERKVRSAVDFKLHELPASGKTVIAVGGLSAGLEYPDAKLAVLTEGEGDRSRPHKKRTVTTSRQKLESYTDLTNGDLVVHEHHGIGRFVGMVKLSVDGVEKDYVKLHYAGADTLYVPATQLDLISKYIGSGEDVSVKKLSKLGGAEWEKTKSRAKKAAKELAKGLILLYAERQKRPGFSFSPDSSLQREFEDDFEYAETDDQLRCIAEVKEDMEKPLPMDRLLCGDVGYGKTEVAFRAVMKCILDGKQAAILVPTTVLARQHYHTALERFSGFPVEVDVVSRFRSNTQIKETLRKLADGSIDLLIGTHRLLQKDMVFRNLGLLVVDEEQRFGVTQKEKLKEIARQVDVLTLSATPIPRTLNMALSGIRDMSVLEEPPVGRQPVQTYVLEHDWGILAAAMQRELERHGQVYYLHNRVETIYRTAKRIEDMLGGDVRVAVAHGKMNQEELGRVMSAMTDGEVDVLVCTTIIEAGIDLSNVNTLIIEDADRLGLSQLHQIRGRVGRSSRRAYAYMTFRAGKVLTEVAAKRLSAIRDFAAFGAGFKIAMRDLEIRGAGNVLGPEQSGFLMSVGYDMYLKLLEEAVLEERGGTASRSAECSADLNVEVSIPDDYVPSPEQRLDLYRRIAHIRSQEDADDLIDELIDRYGDPPKPVGELIGVALLRANASKCAIYEISQKGDNLNFYLTAAEFRRVAALCAREKYRGRLLYSAGERPYLSLRLKKGEDVLRLGRDLVGDFAETAGMQESSS